jgi:hypothetical protein
MVLTSSPIWCLACIVTVSVADGQQVLRREVVVGGEADPVFADFRFTSSADQGVAGLEERNPNIFIYRIDLNDLRSLLTLRGPSPTYIPEFLAEDNSFGADYGAPLLSFRPLRLRTLLSDRHASVFRHAPEQRSQRPQFL